MAAGTAGVLAESRTRGSFAGMKWTVEGADEKTGLDVTITFEAKSLGDAMDVARANGILPADGYPAGSRKAKPAPLLSYASPGLPGGPGAVPVLPRTGPSGPPREPRYVYKMVQVPPSIVVTGKQTGREASDYLEGLVNQWAKDGWEFYRVDTIGIVGPAGCLAALLGLTDGFKSLYVVTFRREARST